MISEILLEIQLPFASRLKEMDVFPFCLFVGKYNSILVTFSSKIELSTN